MDKNDDRKPYVPPAVIHEVKLEVSACGSRGKWPVDATDDDYIEQ